MRSSARPRNQPSGRRPDLMRFWDVLLGRRLANQEAEGRKIGAFEGVPAMGLDGLGSAAYGPEAMLTVLAVAGRGGPRRIGPITWVILVLLAVLFLSYWQTIAAYPSNGGSYTVARENLGANAGLLAAAALMIDYMLNVAVGISAGVGALISAVPALQPYTLPLCLGDPGGRSRSSICAARGSPAWCSPCRPICSSPACAFVLAWAPGRRGPAAAIRCRWWRRRRCRRAAEPVTPVAAAARVRQRLHRYDRRRGGQQRRQRLPRPAVTHAHRTLAAIVRRARPVARSASPTSRTRYGIRAMDETQPGYQSVLSQLIAAVSGRGWFYYVTIGSVLAVLCLSANTSFVGFPRLCRQVAQDGFLPRGFAMPGRRLVYSVGIAVPGARRRLLLIVFGGITDRLIPLFAVGAFLSFTLSQSGMAVHWLRRLRQGEGTLSGNKARLAANATGAIATGLGLRDPRC